MAAGFRADAAMIVHGCMLFAGLSAKLASHHARVQLGVHQFVGRFGLTDQQPRRGCADFRAIEVRANAAT